MATRGTFVFDETLGRLVPKHEYRSRNPRVVQRSSFPSPMVISDAMCPGMSQLDGKIYDSKSALYRSYGDYEARTGKRVEIVGTDTAELMRETPQVADEKGIDEAIKHALEVHAA